MEEGEKGRKGEGEKGRKMKPYKHRVQYYETDRMGVTHHSNYIRWMEEARADYLAQIGWGYERLEAAGLGCPVTAVSCKFKRSTTFADEITVDARIVEYNGAILKLDYVMTDQNGKEVFTGHSEHCFLNANGGLVRLNRVYPEYHEALAASICE